MPSITDLPHEIQQGILDYFEYDAENLKSLSLTCHSFLPRCQRHLFSEIVLFPPSHRKGARTGPRFQALIESSPHIALYVRSLEIVDAVDQDTSFSVRSDQSLEICLPELSRLRALVVRVERYRIDNLRWISLSQGFLLAALLVTLDLPTLQYVDIGPLPLALVDYCHSNLKHLAFELTKKQTLQTIVPFENDTKIVLESLEIRIKRETSIQEHPFLREDSLGKRVDITSLKRLYLRAERSLVGHLTFWNIIKGCSGTLQEIFFQPCTEVYKHYDVDQPHIVDPIEWGVLTYLRVFHIHFDLDMLSFDWSGNIRYLEFSWFMNTLNKLPGQLEEFIVQVEQHFQAGFTYSFWSELTKVLLDKSRFPRLYKVHFRIAINTDDKEKEEITEKIEEHISGMRATMKEFQLLFIDVTGERWPFKRPYRS